MLRLEAEAIRDSVLAVSGRLNPLMGGPGFFPRMDKDLMEGAVTWFEPSPAEARNRRSLYMYQQRSLVLPLVKVFDGTQLDESCAAREVTTVTPQVFVLFNSRFAHEQSRALAGRIVAAVRGRSRTTARASLPTRPATLPHSFDTPTPGVSGSRAAGFGRPDGYGESERGRGRFDRGRPGKSRGAAEKDAEGTLARSLSGPVQPQRIHLYRVMATREDGPLIPGKENLHHG